MTVSELLIGVQEVFPAADLSGFFRVLNRTVRKMAKSHRWNFLRTSVNIQLIEGYSDGTVLITEGSTTVTGTDTTWTSAMSGRKISFSGDLAFYTFTFVSTTSGTLDRNYAKDTDTAATYKIFQDTYAMPSDLLRIEAIKNLESGQKTLPVSLSRFIDEQNSTLLSSSFVAGGFLWAFFGKDSDGNENIVIHRFPGADEFIQVWYLRLPADVTDPSSEPDIPSSTHDWLQLELQLIYALRVKKEDKDPLHIKWLADAVKDARKTEILAESTRRHVHSYNQYTAL